MGNSNVAVDTESEILGNIPGFEDSNDDNKTDVSEAGDIMPVKGEGSDSPSTQTDNTNQEGTGDGQSEDDKKKSEENQGGDGSGAKQSDSEDGKKTGSEQEGAKQPSSGQEGDLIDPVTNQVIARSGVERRNYQREAIYNYHKTKQDNVDLKAQNDVMKQALSASQQLGLTPEEVVRGQRLAAAWRDNPAETIKTLLTEAQKQGIKVEGLADQSAQATINELRGQIEKLEGKNSSGLSEEDQTRIANESAEEVRTLYIQHPEAKLHEQLIAGIIQASTNAQIQQYGKVVKPKGAIEAYGDLAVLANKHGLDLSKPLGPQMEAKKAAANQGDNKANGDASKDAESGQANTSKPLPPSKAQTGEDLIETDSAKLFADEDTSYKSIASQVVAEMKQQNGGKLVL